MPQSWRHAIRTFVLLTGLVLAGLFAQPAHAQSLSWVKQVGSGSPNVGNAIAADGSGNTCVAGAFQGSTTFGPSQVNQTTLTLTSAGVTDLFVAKYNAAGALLWVTQTGSAAADAVYGIAVDGSDNCYVTGVFEGNDNLADTFVTKVDAGGTLLWTKQTGGESESIGYAIAADGDGNSYVTGVFGGSAIFGLGETHETTLDSADSASIFVAKYDTDGALVWAKQTSGSSGSYNAGAGIGVDGDGNSYVTGAFEGAATFGPNETNQAILTSVGGADIFVAKVDPDGALLWARQAGGVSADNGDGIAVDGSGNSYVTGSFEGTATFGPDEANVTPLTSTGETDIFVAKVDPDGALLWAKQAGGASADNGYGIGLDGSGSGYVTGQFQGAATFGPGETLQTVLTSTVGTDIFVAKIDAGGALLWVEQADGTLFESGQPIAVDGGGNSYVAGLVLAGSSADDFFGGSFDGSAALDAAAATVTAPTSAGSQAIGAAQTSVLNGAGFYDTYMAMYDTNGVLLRTTGAWTAIEIGTDIAVDGRGNSYVTGVFAGAATFGRGAANETTLTSAGNFDTFVAKYDAAGVLLWARRSGGGTYDGSQGIAVDESGNSYVIGAQFGVQRLEPDFNELPGNESCVSQPEACINYPNYNIFIAKYDDGGVLLWTKRTGVAVDRHSFNGSFGWDIGVEGSGNSYVTGFFYGHAVFGLGEANETTLASAGADTSPIRSAGSNDIFVAKYNAGGALLWVKQAGGDSDDHGRAIAVDGSGNSYVTGYAGGSLFVANYDPTGALLWTKQADGVPPEDALSALGSGRGLDIGVDGSGNSYITGSFTGDATFGPDEPNETMLISAGNLDIFMAKFEPAGALGWAGRAGGASDDYGRGIAVHESGNSYVTGDFSGAATFGQGETHETTLTSAGQVDIFVANFDPSGALRWASRAGDASDDHGRSIAVDWSGNSYVTGDFTGSVTFGATPATDLRAARATETMLTSTGASDIFLAKYGADVVLPVTLGYFRADRDGDALTFHWQTVTESGTAGFNLLAVLPSGRTQLNNELIPSTVIDAVMPIDYRFAASGNGALRATQFYLQELSIDGEVTELGPFDLGVTYGAHLLPTDAPPSTALWLPFILR